MTRNPETTEAAKVVAALTEKQKEIVCNASAAGMFNSGRVAGLQIAKDIVCAVLAVSPAVTEGERTTELARRAGFAEGLRDAADEAGSWGPSAAHIAMQLRAKAERVEQFNIARTPTAAPSPAVTAAEGDPQDPMAAYVADLESRLAKAREAARFEAQVHGAPAPVVAAVPAEDETGGREKPHTLTRYGTTNCPVEGVRANVDDGECSACGSLVPPCPCACCAERTAREGTGRPNEKSDYCNCDKYEASERCDCPSCTVPAPAVTAAEDETRDPDHCSLIAPHFPHSWGPVDVTNLPNWCIGVPRSCCCCRTSRAAKPDRHASPRGEGLPGPRRLLGR